mgnify:CR=1 FL=1
MEQYRLNIDFNDKYQFYKFSNNVFLGGNKEETKEETKLKDSIIVEEPPGNYKKISPEIIKMMTNSKKY